MKGVVEIIVRVGSPFGKKEESCLEREFFNTRKEAEEYATKLLIADLRGDLKLKIPREEAGKDEY